MAENFDPLGVLQALDNHRVSFIVVGSLARIIQGADEMTNGVDIVPPMREETLRRLDLALAELGARRSDRKKLAPLQNDPSPEPVLALTTDLGELKIIPQPEGTGGYDDLRRAATREYLGKGVRSSIASVGDLARMISALGREDDITKLMAMRRIAELDVGHGLEL
ncbi:MAG: hypothetical protein MSC30_04935 [Gaiellaceae bacterium MAG52_C11]|nr:hypothetical protein [Candidatus Gaiellasilicea maunaloa]